MSFTNCAKCEASSWSRVYVLRMGRFALKFKRTEFTKIKMDRFYWKSWHLCGCHWQRCAADKADSLCRSGSWQESFTRRKFYDEKKVQKESRALIIHQPAAHFNWGAKIEHWKSTLFEHFCWKLNKRQLSRAFLLKVNRFRLTVDRWSGIIRNYNHFVVLRRSIKNLALWKLTI